MLFLVGCANLPPSQNEVERLSAQARVRDSMPTCSNPTECQAKWEAAQIWITRNSAFKIQIATTAVIETYRSVGGSMDMDYRVTKEPQGDGKYIFNLQTHCDNFIACNKDPLATIQDFNNYINSIK